MKLSEINQYLFEIDICKNKSDRLGLETKMKKFCQNYKKPKISPLEPKFENIPPGKIKKPNPINMNIDSSVIKAVISYI